MKLAAALRLTGFNRDTFNTLQRNGSLPFLAGARAGDLWNFDYEHLLALKVFQELRSLGVSLEHCAALIACGWSDISDAVTTARPEHPITLTLVKSVTGHIWYQEQHFQGDGSGAPSQDAGLDSYRLIVNLTAIASDLRSFAHKIVESQLASGARADLDFAFLASDEKA